MADEPLGVLELEDNLADVERPPDIPAGRYIGEVQDIQMGVSQGKGNQYYSVRIVIPNDQIPADLREHYPDGATMSWNRQIVPQRGDRRALYNLRKMIEAFGLDSNTTSIDPNEWMGRRVKLLVGPGNLYQGERRMEIKSLEQTGEDETTQTRRGAATPRAAEPKKAASRRGR